LGTGQLSLAKFLFITAEDKQPLDAHDESSFLQYILERIDLKRDIHFHTNTTIDTLDYSGTGLNSGSKVVFAAYGDQLRDLATSVPDILQNIQGVEHAALVMPGVVAIKASLFSNYEKAAIEMSDLNNVLLQKSDISSLNNIPLIVICDDSDFMAAHLNNFLWATFTRCNPSHDIYGVDSFTEHKHWGCRGPLIMDARIKPHHAPPLIPDALVEKKVDQLMERLKL
jgi:4-hydroxy-3-polyprenylbenzoate decarboxylase